MTIRIRAFDCTLMGKHIHSGEGVLGSNPTSPKFFTKSVRRMLATFEDLSRNQKKSKRFMIFNSKKGGGGHFSTFLTSVPVLPTLKGVWGGRGGCCDRICLLKYATTFFAVCSLAEGRSNRLQKREMAVSTMSEWAGPQPPYAIFHLGRLKNRSFRNLFS